MRWGSRLPCVWMITFDLWSRNRARVGACGVPLLSLLESELDATCSAVSFASLLNVRSAHQQPEEIVSTVFRIISNSYCDIQPSRDRFKLLRVEIDVHTVSYPNHEWFENVTSIVSRCVPRQTRQRIKASFDPDTSPRPGVSQSYPSYFHRTAHYSSTELD